MTTRTITIMIMTLLLPRQLLRGDRTGQLIGLTVGFLCFHGDLIFKIIQKNRSVSGTSKYANEQYPNNEYIYSNQRYAANVSYGNVPQQPQQQQPQQETEDDDEESYYVYEDDVNGSGNQSPDVVDVVGEFFLFKKNSMETILKFKKKSPPQTTNTPHNNPNNHNTSDQPPDNH